MIAASVRRPVAVQNAKSVVRDPCRADAWVEERDPLNAREPEAISYGLLLALDRMKQASHGVDVRR